MRKNLKNKSVRIVSNPLAGYDPYEPEHIPEEFIKPYKRSVYFPETKAPILYQVNEMMKEARRAGTKVSFSDMVIEALELWYQQNLRRHLSWVLYRLRREKDTLAAKLKIIQGKSESNVKERELSTRQEKIAEAMEQIERFLSLHQRIIPTGDFEMLIKEIIESLDKHSSIEMKRALLKVLARSDIHELAAQVRHKPKIKKKKSIFRIAKDEEPEWYE